MFGAVASSCSKYFIMTIPDFNRTNLPKIPNFDCPIFASCDQPFSFAVKRHRCHIHGMAFECDELEQLWTKILRGHQIPTGSDDALAISYIRTFLWIAAANSRLLVKRVSADHQTVEARSRAHSGDIAKRLTCYFSQEIHSLLSNDKDKSLTPDSPVRAIVREHMPLQASQKRISWS